MAETILSTPVRYLTPDDELVDAEFRLEEKRVIVEDENLTLKVDIEDIFDIRIGTPPPAVDDVFAGKILNVGYEFEGRREVMFVDSKLETLEQVSGLLFRSILNHIEVAARHPMKVGGRVTGKSPEVGKLLVAPEKLGCPDIDVPFNIDVDQVVDFDRSEMELLGEKRPTIIIQYVTKGVAVTLELSLSTPRKLHLLGRFLRYEYDSVRESLRSIEIPDAAGRVLIRLYSLRGRAKAQSLFRQESVSTASLLRGLLRADLVEMDDGQLTLTPRGWILVTEHFGQRQPSIQQSSSTDNLRA